MSQAMSIPDNVRALPAARALQDELHVWLVKPEEITAPPVLDRYSKLLSEEETERCRKYRFASDRHLYLVSHALVRNTLSRYVSLLPSSWQFSTSPHGKPEIANPELPVPLRFSLSHTPGLIACLVAQEVDCGVDVEAISARRDVKGIAARMFTLQEQQQLDRMEGEAALQQFFAYWTLHEAYGKALGCGLAHIGHELGFAGTGAGVYSMANGSIGDAAGWQLQVMRPTAGHVLALAVRRASAGPRAVVARWVDS
jgi:4'-phosphopantetheinyl transferase